MRMSDTGMSCGEGGASVALRGSERSIFGATLPSRILLPSCEDPPAPRASVPSNLSGFLPDSFHLSQSILLSHSSGSPTCRGRIPLISSGGHMQDISISIFTTVSCCPRSPYIRAITSMSAGRGTTRGASGGGGGGEGGGGGSGPGIGGPARGGGACGVYTCTNGPCARREMRPLRGA